MKKLIYKFGVALLAFAAVSCQEELSVPVFNSVDIKVVAEDVDEVVASKTYISQSSDGYQAGWSATDAITLYEFVDDSLSQTVTSKQTVLSNNNSRAEFSISLTSKTGDKFLYEAIHPSGALTKSGNGENVFYRFMIPATQSLVIDANSDNTINMDPAADILIGKPVHQDAQASSESGLSFQFKRPGTIGKLSLSGIWAGEKLKNIKITAPVNIVGYSKINLSTGEVDAGYSATKELTLNIPCTSEQYIETSSGSTYTFYFRCLSGTWGANSDVTVVLTTDKAIYTKTATLPKDYVFDESGLTAFGFDLSNNTERTEVVDYSGQYVIMSGNFVMAGFNNGNYYDKVDAGGGTLAALYEIENINNYVWTVVKTDAGYSLQNNEGYLALTAADNKAHSVSELDEDGNTTYFDITPDGDNMVVRSKEYSARTLRYNSGNPRFAFYEKGQTAIQFVKWTSDSREAFASPSNVSFNGSTKSVSWTATEGATNGYEYTLDDGASVTAITTNSIDCSAWANGDYSVKVRVKATTDKKTSTWSTACDFSISGGSESVYYTKVTENQEDWSGVYLLCSGTEVLTHEKNSTKGYISATISVKDGKILASDEIDAYQVVIEKSGTGYSVMIGDEYLSKPSSSGGIATVSSVSSDADRWSPSISGLYNVSSTSWNLRNNSSVTVANGRFRVYSGTTGSIVEFYKYQGVVLPNCADPVITLNGAEATITCETVGATIRYTTDNSDPTESSNVYSVPVTLTNGQTIKAKAFKEGYNASNVVSETYSASTTTSWKLVTDASTLASGDVIKLGCAAKGKAAGAMGSNSYLSSVDATISNGVLTCEKAIEITLGGSAGAWTLTTSEGQITTSAAKAFKLGTGTQKTWTISISDGVATITGGSYGYIQYNSGSPRFVNYTSAQTAIEIYKKTNN